MFPSKWAFTVDVVFLHYVWIYFITPRPYMCVCTYRVRFLSFFLLRVVFRNNHYVTPTYVCTYTIEVLALTENWECFNIYSRSGTQIVRFSQWRIYIYFWRVCKAGKKRWILYKKSSGNATEMETLGEGILLCKTLRKVIHNNWNGNDFCWHSLQVFSGWIISYENSTQRSFISLWYVSLLLKYYTFNRHWKRYSLIISSGCSECVVIKTLRAKKNTTIFFTIPNRLTSISDEATYRTNFQSHHDRVRFIKFRIKPHENVPRNRRPKKLTSLKHISRRICDFPRRFLPVQIRVESWPDYALNIYFLFLHFHFICLSVYALELPKSIHS